jgi:hypothetical protein
MTEATEDGSTTAGGGREPIALPEWLPPSVAEQVRLIEAEKQPRLEAHLTMMRAMRARSGLRLVASTSQGLTAEQRVILQRLATDARMRRVWMELTRRKRPTGGFLHPAKQLPNRPPAVTQEEAQAWALGQLFFHVLIVAICRPEVSKLDDVAPQKAKFLEYVRVLREIADMLTDANPGGNPDVAGLRRVARRFEYAVSTLRQPGDPLIIKNDRGDRVVRGVQIFCGILLIEIFGERLDRTAATLAAVGLGTPTSARVTRSAFSRRKGA